MKLRHYPRVRLWKDLRDLYSLSGRTSYRKISWSFKAGLLWLHFIYLERPPVNYYFEHARIFLPYYDRDRQFMHGNKLQLQVINDVFTLEEITVAICALKNIRYPGCNGFLAECIKTWNIYIASLCTCSPTWLRKGVSRVHDQKVNNIEIRR